MPTEPHVLVVDDHQIVREWLRFSLTKDGFAVTEASDGASAIETAKAVRPDAVVLDLGLGDLPGAAVCQAILADVPTTTVLVLSSAGDEQAVSAAIAAGARGYLIKHGRELDVPSSLRRLLAGEHVIDPRAAGALMRSLSTPKTERPRLTGQEREILRLAAGGLTNQEIGREMYLSRHTVKEYLSNAMRKLGVRTRVEAVLEATRLGLLSDDGRAGAQRADSSTASR